MPSTFFFSCSKENLCWVRFHLWQRALHPSQVEMWWGRRMSWWVRWIRSSMQWVAQSGVSQTCSYIKAQRNWSCYSQHLQDNLSIYTCVRTKITDTKDSGHSNHMVYKLSNVPVFQTMIQAVLSSLDFCLQGNCKHLELLVRLMISSRERSVTLTWDQAFGNWDLVFCMVTYWNLSSLQTALLLLQRSFAMLLHCSIFIFYFSSENKWKKQQMKDEECKIIKLRVSVTDVTTGNTLWKPSK